MARSKPADGQAALFDAPAKPAKAAPRPVIQWPGGIRPWDPIDAADTELGWQYRWIDHRRAVEIRQEIEVTRA